MKHLCMHNAGCGFITITRGSDFGVDRSLHFSIHYNNEPNVTEYKQTRHEVVSHDNIRWRRLNLIEFKNEEISFDGRARNGTYGHKGLEMFWNRFLKKFVHRRKAEDLVVLVGSIVRNEHYNRRRRERGRKMGARGVD